MTAIDSDEVLGHEIRSIARVIDEHGAISRRDLEPLVGARYWGPGRFGRALREAVHEGRVRRGSGLTYIPPAGDGSTG